MGPSDPFLKPRFGIRGSLPLEGSQEEKLEAFSRFRGSLARRERHRWGKPFTTKVRNLVGSHLVSGLGIELNSTFLCCPLLFVSNRQAKHGKPLVSGPFERYSGKGKRGTYICCCRRCWIGLAPSPGCSIHAFSLCRIGVLLCLVEIRWFQ